MSEIRDLIWKYSQDPDTSQGSAEDSTDNTAKSFDDGDDLSESIRQGHHGHQHHGYGTDD